MKLLACPLGCARMFVALGAEPLDCACGRTGGVYNPDGDTVTVWGDGRLLGLSNRAVLRLLGGADMDDFDGDSVLWPYPEDNGKVTRLDARPVGTQP
jgi:hypothetical protein